MAAGYQESPEHAAHQARAERRNLFVVIVFAGIPLVCTLGFMVTLAGAMANF